MNLQWPSLSTFVLDCVHVTIIQLHTWKWSITICKVQTSLSSLLPVYIYVDRSDYLVPDSSTRQSYINHIFFKVAVMKYKVFTRPLLYIYIYVCLTEIMTAWCVSILLETEIALLSFSSLISSHPERSFFDWKKFLWIEKNVWITIH